MLLDGVDVGDLQIHGFDGGLFDPAKCPILDDPALVIGDTYVRDLVDALCWTQPALSVNRRDQVARRRVNYRELGVEQLGSIYEGLLAFEPTEVVLTTLAAWAARSAGSRRRGSWKWPLLTKLRQPADPY